MYNDAELARREGVLDILAPTAWMYERLALR
jgi:hypothetical protein